MKYYQKLKLPKDSSWGKKTWRTYTHWRIKYLIDGIHNIIRWMPTLFHDKDWDDYYVTKMLQKKIEYQREYIVKHNRHTRVDEDNFWMTVVLNLIEREHEEYYALEKYDYTESNIKFIDSETHPGSYEMLDELVWEELDIYLTKYPSAVRKVKQQYPDKDFTDKETLSLYVGIYNQKRNRNLIFEILKRYSNRWWD